MKTIGIALLILLVVGLIGRILELMIQNILIVLCILGGGLLLTAIILLITKIILLVNYKKTIKQNAKKYEEVSDNLRNKVRFYIDGNLKSFLNINLYYFIPDYGNFSIDKHHIDYLLKSKIKLLSKIKNKNDYIQQISESLKYIHKNNNLNIFKAFQLVKNCEYYSVRDINKIKDDINKAKHDAEFWESLKKYGEASEYSQKAKKLQRELKIYEINKDIYPKYKIINEIHNKLLNEGVIAIKNSDKHMFYVAMQVEIIQLLNNVKEVLSTKYNILENETLESFTRKLYKFNTDKAFVCNQYQVYKNETIESEKELLCKIENIIREIQSENVTKELASEYKIKKNESLESFTKKLYEFDMDGDKICEYYLSYINNKDIDEKELLKEIKNILTNIEPNNMYFAYTFPKDIRDKYVYLYEINKMDNDSEATKKIVNGFIKEIKQKGKVFENLDKSEKLRKVLMNFSIINDKGFYLVRYLPYLIVDAEKNKSKYTVFELLGKIQSLKESINSSKIKKFGYESTILNIYQRIENNGVILNQSYMKPIRLIKNEDSFNKGLYNGEYEYYLNKYKEINKNIIVLFEDLLCEDEFKNITKNLVFAEKIEILCSFIYYYALQNVENERTEYINRYKLDEESSEIDIINVLCNYKLSDNQIIEIIQFVKRSYLNIEDDSESIEENLELVKKEIQRKARLENLENGHVDKKIKITDIDLMSGYEFEKYISRLFQKMGYSAYATQETNDQGVDVIAEKGDVKIAIQTKCYNGVVGNSAIQEIVAGMKYYDADKAMVITNSTFTRSAIELAQKNNVQLWDRKTLIEKIDEVL
ncbi:MAG: restriction endonuclease [Clostridia bacterium]|nr:restriction endonuclease [Clostridia bacterium]